MTATNLPNLVELEEFLKPLDVDIDKIHALARSLSETFKHLAKESKEQFLSTPISEEVLRPERESEGRYLAIDIGGSNLRAGFIELLGPSDEAGSAGAGKSRVNRLLEKSWQIGEEHKSDNADELFAWIGKCIAEVVQDGVNKWGEELPDELPMGVTFSFPMIQNTLSEAILMSMGKGFAITSNLNLGEQLMKGYATATVSQSYLPRIRIAAIVNDAVATLISFAYQFRNSPHQKAAMGLIVGTGCNATIPLALSKLHPSKRPSTTLKSTNHKPKDTKLTINTEWSINGTAPPLHDLNFVTKWDTILSNESETPGFMPFEYMTSGRYLGELGRLIILDYFTTHLNIPASSLPPQLRERNALDASILASVGRGPQLCQPLDLALPFPSSDSSSPEDPQLWTPQLANILVTISKKIQQRAAGMAAAAVIGLLACADEIHFSAPNASPSILRNGGLEKEAVRELMVGYTGSCIVHFQDYLVDCQGYLDAIMRKEFKVPGGGKGIHGGSSKRVVLEACHDGGIIGAGILAGTVVGLQTESVETEDLDV